MNYNNFDTGTFQHDSCDPLLSPVPEPEPLIEIEPKEEVKPKLRKEESPEYQRALSKYAVGGEEE